MTKLVSVLAHGGPMARYENLVQQGRLREDSHQRGISVRLRCSFILAVVGVLQKLYTDLFNYKPSEIPDHKLSYMNGSSVLFP
jgi:hypothetical protein